MQFSIAILAAASVAFAQSVSTTVVDAPESTVVETITSCGSEYTNCPASSTEAPASTTVATQNSSNVTVPSVSTYEGAANNMYASAGVAAAAAIAAFLL